MPDGRSRIYQENRLPSFVTYNSILNIPGSSGTNKKVYITCFGIVYVENTYRADLTSDIG